MEERESCFLDHAGTAPVNQLAASLWLEEVCSGPVSENPHTDGPTHAKVQRLRDVILQYFGTTASDYSVVFTVRMLYLCPSIGLNSHQGGATDALRKAADVFPWSERSVFASMNLNHNSTLGIREVAQEKGCRLLSFNLSKFLEPSELASDLRRPPAAHGCHHMVAFPGECNFSGSRVPLDLITELQATEYSHGSRIHVLLDAAKLCSTQALKLGTVKPSFVAVSFYKIFGWPTGLGALLVHQSVAPFLQKVC